LRDGKDGSRFILNTPGQGYCFVAPVTRVLEQPAPSVPQPEVKPPQVRHAADVIGRTVSITAVVAQLAQRRLLTIVGPGGIGKTTVANAVADVMAETLADGAAIVSLSTITDVEGVSSSIGRAIGLEAGDPGSLQNIITWLRNKQLLIVLDNCEHVIAKAAEI